MENKKLELSLKKLNKVDFLRKLLPFCLVLLMGIPAILNAQDLQKRVISGTVKDKDDLPVVGTSVQIKGTRKSTAVDAEGKYKIEVAAEPVTLIFSFIGYETQEKAVSNNGRVINVVLRESSSALDEVVVVGYGTMKRKDLTGSVANIKKEVIETKVATSVVDYLKGNVAGIHIGVDNSAAGGGSIQIRGPASLTASTSPLIVLNGNIFYGNIADINPNDVESMDVLKDASSTAIYGSKGSAGVIMINTKKGKTGKPVIDISTRFGVGSLLYAPALPTPEQYVRRRADYWKTRDYFNPKASQKAKGYYDDPSNLPEGVTKEQWAAYEAFSGDYVETWLTRLQFSGVEMENYKLGKTVDWRDQVYRSGLRKNYNASVSGKSGKMNYYVSLGHTGNQGYKVGDNFQSTRGSANFDMDVTNWLKIGANTLFADKLDNTVVANTGTADSMSPYGTLYNPDGSINPLPTGDARVVNPLLATEVDSKFNKGQTLTSTLYSQIKLPFGISVQTNYTNRYGWRKQYYYRPDVVPGTTVGGEASRDEFSDYEWILDNMLKWNYTINDTHNFDATVVVSSEKYQSWGTAGTNEGFVPNGNLGYHNLNAGINPVTTSDDQIQTGNSVLGRLNYTLLGRYILTSSVRRDGFSAFGANNPYGIYPAFAAAWRISDESFMKGSGVDNLKLRLSWGETGNRDIGRYVALSKLNVTDNIIGGENVKGVWTNNLANSGLKWERTQARNIGVDFSLFKDRLSGAVDVYANKTSDLIMTQALVDITGYKTVIANLGQVNNKGLELTLNSVNINIPKKITWSSTFLYSMNKNSIEHLYGNMIDVKDANGNVTGQREADDIQNGWYIGHGIYDIFDYKMIGIWQLDEAVEAAKFGKRPGDPKLLDVNNNGVIGGEEDKVWLGSKTPKFGVSLRNDFNLFSHFSFSFTLRGDFNYLGEDNLARNEDNRFFDRSNSIMNDYWTPEHPSNEYAALGSNSSNPGVRIYKKRDFVRLQDASFYYSFPKEMLKRFSIENLKVGLNVDNGFVITNWTYFDPENAGTAPRIFTLGLNLTL